MKQILIILSLTLSLGIAYGQQCAKIDSLTRVARFSKTPEDKVNTLNALSEALLVEKAETSLLYAQQALQIAKANKFAKGQADALMNIGQGESREHLDHRLAEEQFAEAIKIYDSLGLKKKLAEAYEAVGNFYYERFYIDSEFYEKGRDMFLKAIALREEQDAKAELALDYDMLGNIYSQLSQNKDAIDYFMKAVEIREALQDDTVNDPRLLAKARQVYEIELARQRWFILALVLGTIALAAMGFIIFAFFIRKGKESKQLAADKAEMEQAKAEIEAQNEQAVEEKDILALEQRLKDQYSLLPEVVYQEIKEAGKYTVRQHDQASILFADLEDFTHISKGMNKENLIDELNTCFAAFDKILEEHKVTKLKTLGDAYMAAGGIPEEYASSAVDTVLAALQMQEFVQERYREKAEAGEPYWKLRIGINTGYVTTGVVGYRKFTYDVWGETVNTAKLLEGQSEAHEITIAHSTYELVQDFFDCEEIRAAQIKHKGELRQFVVKGIKVHLSEEALGKTPNTEFWQRHEAIES